ncbi:MAG: hypothetical protein ACRD4O_10840, partial [Bryobacteraceae bacterium]
ADGAHDAVIADGLTDREGHVSPEYQRRTMVGEAWSPSRARQAQYIAANGSLYSAKNLPYTRRCRILGRIWRPRSVRE